MRKILGKFTELKDDYNNFYKAASQYLQDN
jgi:hypothetical protein